MNILLISARADHGGGPHSTFKLAREFNKRGHSMYVAVPKDRPYFDMLCSELGAPSIVEIPHRKVSLIALYEVASFIRRNSIQLLHSNGKGAGAYAKLLSAFTGVPFIHTPRGIHVFEYSRIKMWLYRKYENSFNNRCKAVVFVSESEKLRSENLSLWSSVPNLVINNGISLNRTRENVRNSIPRSIPFHKHDFVVATITRFDVSKNMSEAFLIARLCPDICFLWIGDGPDSQLLKDEAFQMGVNNVHFFGESDDPIKLLAYCDVYLSTSRWEGLPNSLLEAGLMALPCVVTRVTGNIDVVRDGENGFLYDLGDTTTAAMRLKNLKTNDSLRSRLAFNARKRIEEYFSDDVMFEQYQSLYCTSIGDQVSL